MARLSGFLSPVSSPLSTLSGHPCARAVSPVTSVSQLGLGAIEEEGTLCLLVLQPEPSVVVAELEHRGLGLPPAWAASLALCSTAGVVTNDPTVRVLQEGDRFPG